MINIFLLFYFTAPTSRYNVDSHPLQNIIHTLHTKKQILKEKSFTHIYLYSSFFSFLLIKIPKVDFTIKFSYVLSIHHGMSSIFPVIGILTDSTMYTTISSDNLLLNFWLFQLSFVTKYITSSSSSSALSLSTWYKASISVQLSNQILHFPTLTCHYMLCFTSSFTAIIFLYVCEIPCPFAIIG